jgi:hypothetical protein
MCSPSGVIPAEENQFCMAVTVGFEGGGLFRSRSWKASASSASACQFIYLDPIVFDV